MASSIMESLLQRTLEDLVKGIRVQMIGESRFIATHLEEIRKEIKSTDPHMKTVALQKLIYINMLSGIDMDWAAFHVVEAMSMSKFAHKKIGYLAASRSFHETTDVLLLITNQLRKDLSSNNEYEAGLALECLSCIATPDLAQQLTPEVFALLASGRLYVRTRATVVILKLFTKYPDAVRIACKRLVEKLEDADPKVVSAAVSVFCEMAMKDATSCIPLAPEFYRLLVDSKDNWLLIKVVKIFGVLAPIEPRLSRRIAEPLCELMRNTIAKSLLLECIRTVIIGLPDHAEALKLAVEKLKELLQEEDPNLKYLGLQALASLMPAHPWAVAENKAMILSGLNDEDHSIQIASLQLILGMVSEVNVIDTVHILLQYAERAEVTFCNELIGAILATCSRGLYELVPDFTWYLSILGRMARLRDSTHGKELERQLVDIGIRVKEVRSDLVAVARGILLDPSLLEYPSLHRVLSAVAWIAGEYVEFSQSPFELIEALLQPRTKLLPSAVQAVYLQSVLKVFVYLSYTYLNDASKQFNAHSTVETPLLGSVERNAESELVCSRGEVDRQEATPEEGLLLSNGHDREGSSIAEDSLHDDTVYFEKNWVTSQNSKLEQDAMCRLFELIELNVGPMVERIDVEVQERACNVLGVSKAFKEAIDLSGEIQLLSQEPSSEKASEMIQFLRNIFCEELGPVSVFAQSRVAVPDGLVLVKNLDSLDALFRDEEEVLKEKNELSMHEMKAREWEVVGPASAQKTNEEGLKNAESTSLLAQHRQRHGTYYLPVERDIMKLDEYPPPQMAHSDPLSTPSASTDFMKQAEQSLSWTKTRQMRPRPVIVRLDDTDEDLVPLSKAKSDLNDNVVSSAIKDVLVGVKAKQLLTSASKEDMLSSGSTHSHRKGHRPSRHHSKNEAQEATVNLLDTKEEAVKKSGKKHGTHKHSKHASVVSSLDGESSGKERHGEASRRHRSRHRARSPVVVSPQTPIIPDFLL